MTKPMHENDRKLTDAEKITLYNSFTGRQKWFFGSAEGFCRRNDVYENYDVPGTYYFVDIA